MRKTVLMIGIVNFLAFTANAQIKVKSDAAPFIEQQSAEFKGSLVDPTNVLEKKELPDAPKPVEPVRPTLAPTPCPAGVGKPCALLGGRAFFPDPVHMTEHDKSWKDAMKNRGILLGVGMNAAAAVWDYKTTRHCVDTHRGKEGNPLMGQSQAQELSVGISGTALLYVLSGKLKQQGDGNYAFGVLWGGTMLHFFAGAHNWSVCHG
jgi:hypothetical protein